MNNIEYFSTEALDLLKREFEANAELYTAEGLTQESFWAGIQRFLRANKLSDPVATLPDLELPQKMEPADLSKTELGLFLYRRLGVLEPAVRISEQFWSLISHKYLFESIREGGLKKNQFFFVKGGLKPFNAHRSCREYLGAVWAAEFIEDDSAVGRLPGITLEEAVGWSDSMADAILNMIERLDFNHRALRSAVIAFLLQYKRGSDELVGRLFKERPVQREFWKHVRRISSGAALEVLSYDDLYKMLHSQVVTSGRTACLVYEERPPKDSSRAQYERIKAALEEVDAA